MSAAVDTCSILTLAVRVRMAVGSARHHRRHKFHRIDVERHSLQRLGHAIAHVTAPGSNDV